MFSWVPLFLCWSFHTVCLHDEFDLCACVAHISISFDAAQFWGRSKLKKMGRFFLPCLQGTLLLLWLWLMALLWHGGDVKNNVLMKVTRHITKAAWYRRSKLIDLPWLLLLLPKYTKVYSGVTADWTEVLLLFFYCVFSPLIYTCITWSLNNKNTIMKKDDNKVVIVDTDYLSVLCSLKDEIISLAYLRL